MRYSQQPIEGTLTYSRDIHLFKGHSPIQGTPYIPTKLCMLYFHPLNNLQIISSMHNMMDVLR